ncbi:MAG: pectate lyase [Deltaproteobacteria bacterium]|nr:pectate lyase [Deltaproteobacteria bacterium]
MVKDGSYTCAPDRKKFFFTIVLVFCTSFVSLAAALSYQGFGANALGGEGRAVYRVTNLNDSGPGSLRDALSQANRYIVFDVAGVVAVSSRLFVAGANITVDGFTAPYPGITIKNYGLYIDGARGAHDVIVRGVRIQIVNNQATVEDGIAIHGTSNVVIDHVSVRGATDENIGINNARDVTISWSLLAEPLSSHAMLIVNRASRISVHHNLFVKAQQRNPQVSYGDGSNGLHDPDTTLDMRNNFVWDWGAGYGTRIRYGARANAVNNFHASNGGDAEDALIVCKGVSSDADCDNSSSNIAQAYVAGNVSGDGLTDRINNQGTVTQPFPAPLIDMTNACTAAHQILSDAGITPRDLLEQQYLSAISLPSCEPSHPIVDVSPARLDFSTLSGTSDPASKTLAVSQTSGSGLPWTAVAGAKWLSVTPASGGTPSNITVLVNSTGLAAGSHLSSISITAPGAENSPLMVPVVLNVSSAPLATAPQLTNPTAGSALPGANVNFQWTNNGATVKRWQLVVGSSQGGSDLYDSGRLGRTLSKTVSGLPTDGRALWAQLRFEINGAWQSADFRYIAALQ